jgi:hypothetical protein
LTHGIHTIYSVVYSIKEEERRGRGKKKRGSKGEKVGRKS